MERSGEKNETAPIDDSYSARIRQFLDGIGESLKPFGPGNATLFDLLNRSFETMQNAIAAVKLAAYSACNCVEGCSSRFAVPAHFQDLAEGYPVERTRQWVPAQNFARSSQRGESPLLGNGLSWDLGSSRTPIRCHTPGSSSAPFASATA